MLVLSRRYDESIMIGDNTEITVTDIDGGKARLGIKAPRDIKVLRGELYDTYAAEEQKPKNKKFSGARAKQVSAQFENNASPDEAGNLVLTRSSDQHVMIGDNVMVKVVQVGDGKVSLGIDAPRDVTVHRKEVYTEIKAKEAKIASKSASTPPPSTNADGQNNYDSW